MSFKPSIYLTTTSIQTHLHSFNIPIPRRKLFTRMCDSSEPMYTPPRVKVSSSSKGVPGMVEEETPFDVSASPFDGSPFVSAGWVTEDDDEAPTSKGAVHCPMEHNRA